MLARYEFPFRSPSFKPEATPHGRSLRHGLVVLGGFTAVYLGWLFLHLVSRPLWLAALPDPLAELLQLAEWAGFLTLALVWGVVWWQGRAEPATAVVPIDRETLFSLSPAEFERYVALLFRRKGYRVKLRGRSGDRGVDLMVSQTGGKKAIVQCKRYRKPVGPDVVRELYGTLMHERVAHAFLVTTADISDSARQWARGKPMTLIDGATLAQIAAALGDPPPAENFP